MGKFWEDGEDMKMNLERWIVRLSSCTYVYGLRMKFIFVMVL